MYNQNRAKEELNKILEQPEYQVYYEDNRSLFEKLWDQAQSWLADLLANWFSSFEPSSGVANGILISVIVVVVVLLVGAIFIVGRNYRRKQDFRDNKPLQSINEINWSFKNHLAEAKRQEELQQYSLSTRHLFLALLLYFHEKEWLEARIWKTNWEYYDELTRVNQSSAEQFYNLALIFDEVAYGERTMEQTELVQYKNEVMNWLEETEYSNHS
ncbi:DUF4129 domain-containing protein [Aquibacillus saliphilus]|uniref:DUF4129 domain-containing protein n=1 Tax=Aquibacillus saliphilus TaxID=1909422 RepID=UPI001CF0308D|nr:DUF4129 domain-containing protein [Aquibacillus saliphilus]